MEIEVMSYAGSSRIGYNAIFDFSHLGDQVCTTILSGES